MDFTASVGLAKLLLVHLVDQVEAFHQNVARSAGRVDERQVLHPVDDELAGAVGLVLHQVGHLPFERAGRMLVQPGLARSVLHHVLHNPVGREDLGGGGDVFGFSLLALLEGIEDFVLLLGDVVLIKPTDELHLAVLLRGEGVGVLLSVLEQVQKAARLQHVVRQQQLREVVWSAKHLAQGAVLAAVARQEQRHRLLLLAVVADHLVKAGAVFVAQERRVALAGAAQHQRLQTAGIGVQIQLGLVVAATRQDAHRHDAVEPRVRRLLDDHIAAALLHGLLQRAPQFRRTRDRRGSDRGG